MSAYSCCRAVREQARSYRSTPAQQGQSVGADLVREIRRGGTVTFRHAPGMAPVPFGAFILECWREGGYFADKVRSYPQMSALSCCRAVREQARSYTIKSPSP